MTERVGGGAGEIDPSPAAVGEGQGVGANRRLHDDGVVASHAAANARITVATSIASMQG
jgi:hypothetical protein